MAIGYRRPRVAEGAGIVPARSERWGTFVRFGSESDGNGVLQRSSRSSRQPGLSRLSVNLGLVSFAAVEDSGAFLDNVSPDDMAKQEFACGL